MPGSIHFKPFPREKRDDITPTVNSLIKSQPQSWDMVTIQSIFLPINCDRILTIPLSPIPCPDQLVWFPAIDGKYTIKRGYWLQFSLSKQSVPSSSC